MTKAFSRRFLLQASAGGLFLPAIAGATVPGTKQETLEQAAIWGLPLVLTGRYLTLSGQRGFANNRLYLSDHLATPSLKVVGPNIDTLYGFGWLDLANGPIVLDVPAIPDRYYSIQLIDAYANSFSYIGTRATGSKAGTYAIVPPGFAGTAPGGAHVIEAPTSTVLILTRTLVKSTADLSTAQAVQLSYTLAPLANYPAGKQAGTVQHNVLNVFPAIDLTGDGPAFFSALDTLVQRFPPHGQEQTAFRKLASLKLGNGFSAQSIPPEDLTRALADAVAKIKAATPSTANNGWHVDYHNQPFNTDPIVRAAINIYGPGAHIAKEALYFFAGTDSAKQKLDGSHSYTITFAKGGLPPVKAFWSLILYDSNMFLVDNTINRYAINDRTENLVYEPDGSLQIVVQHTKPSGSVNWLPAPQVGFSLILRTYLPEPSVLSGAYQPPAVVRSA